MEEVLMQEINWCECNRGTSGKGDSFEDGFVAGLRQALFLIEKLRRDEDSVAEISNIKTPSNL